MAIQQRDEQGAAALLDRIAELSDKMRSIDLQLSSRDVRSAEGARLTAWEYWDWRKRALAAKQHMERELSRCKRDLTALGGPAFSAQGVVLVGEERGKALQGLVRGTRKLLAASRHLAETCPDDAVVQRDVACVHAALRSLVNCCIDRDWLDEGVLDAEEG